MTKSKPQFIFFLRLSFIILLIGTVGCSENNEKIAKEKFNQATTAFTSKDLDKAFALYTEAINLDKTLYNAYLNRGNCLQLMNKNKEAIIDFTTYIDQNKNGKHLMNAYFARGISFHQTGQFQEAITDYTKAIAIQPNFTQALFNRSKEYLMIGDTVSCCADLQTCLDLGFKEAEKDKQALCEKTL